jgi:hypothetical protein
MDRFGNYLFFLGGVSLICLLNYATGRAWSRLDHNPWTGKFLGGRLSGPSPGWNPGALDVAEIRQRGRAMMTLSPIAFCIICVLMVIYFINH